MEKKVNELLRRCSEVEEELANPAIFNDNEAYKKLTREHAYLNDVKSAAHAVFETRKALDDDRELYLSEKDGEMRSLLEEEIKHLEERLPALENALEILLVPPDPDDDRNIIMELRAGTGGDEAALFVGDCVRMYQLYAENKGWKWETLSCSPSDIGGYKEYIMVISGPKAKRFLQYEAGVHRVQRVPDTETQGRVHTSAITVAVMLEPTEDEEINLDEKELRIDTYRSSGAGGQHVNTTDSAVRITHIPTGVVAYCQDERSQHKNKDKAMRLLSAKIADAQRQKKQAEEASLRASQIGSGDRSERIRTYNFPQNRVSDHRIELTVYSLEYVMKGDLDVLTEPLVKHYYQEKLMA